MTALLAADTPLRSAPSAAVATEVTLPRAVHSDDPFIRLIGWFLTGTGGRWSGSPSELLAALRDEAGERAAGDVAHLGANASTFSRRLFAARADLERVGIEARPAERRRDDGSRGKVWDLVARDVRPLTPAPHDDTFDSFVADRLVTCEFEERCTTAEVYTAYCAWCVLEAREPWGYLVFCRALKREAEQRGAYPTRIDGGKGWKGIRLANLPPPAAAAKPDDAAGAAPRPFSLREIETAIGEALGAATFVRIETGREAGTFVRVDEIPETAPDLLSRRNRAMRIALALAGAAVLALVAATFLAGRG